MKIDRRGTLGLLFAGLAQASLGGTLGCAAAAKQPLRSIPLAGSKGLIYYCLRGSHGSCILRIEDWETGVREDFTIPIELPHSVNHDARDPSILYVFEVFGSAAKIDLKTGVATRVDHKGTTAMFNGHGVHDLSHGEIVCTEIHPDKNKTVTTIRDAETLAMKTLAPEECHYSHHIAALPGSTLVANGILRTPTGKRGGVTFYDHAKREVVKYVELGEPIIHVFPLSDEEVIAMARPVRLGKNFKPSFSTEMTSQQNSELLMNSAKLEAGAIYHVTKTGHVKRFWDASRKDLMKGGFGVGRYGLRDSFLSSHSASNAVLSWKDGEIASVLNVPDPQTIIVSPDRKEFVVHSLGVAIHHSFDDMKPIKTTSFERPIVLMGTFTRSYS